jgi:hypothetical protein
MLALVVLSLLVAALPQAVGAAQSPMTASVIPYPNNAENTPDGTLPAFVTEDEFAAFDITVGNPAGSSSVTGVSVVATANMPAAFYGFVETNDANNQVSCSWTSPRLSCSMGNFAAGTSVSMRVIFNTPTGAAGQTLTLALEGVSSGASSSDRPGQSRGDTFKADGAILLVERFIDGAAERGAAEFIPANLPAIIETADEFTSDANPTWSKAEVPAPGSVRPYGSYGFLKEHDDGTPGFECPAGASCFGQAIEFKYLDGLEAPAPIRVTVRFDEAKAERSTPKKVTIYHVPTFGVVQRPFDLTCVMGEDNLPLVTPCGESRTAATDDKDDFILVFWLDRNGYTRGG